MVNIISIGYIISFFHFEVIEHLWRIFEKINEEKFTKQGALF